MDAPPGSLQALLAVIHTHLLECKVCMETFNLSVDEEPDRRPMILCCGHVLCAECVCLLTSTDGRALHCPFCRLPGDQTRVSLCRPITDLQELLLEHERSTALGSAPRPAGVEREGIAPGPGRALECGALRLVQAFGGWGTLVNPTGLGLFRSGALAVVHDGKSRVAVFGPQGRRLHAFGRKGGGAGTGVGLRHPLGVAVLPGGQVAVSDAGDSALKVFTPQGGAVSEVHDWFQLPWGVCVSHDGGVLVVDGQRGALVRLEVRTCTGAFGGTRVLLEGLTCPQAIACCPLTGHVAVVEHTHSHTQTSQHSSCLQDTDSSKHTHTPGHTLVPKHGHTRSAATHTHSCLEVPPPLCLTAVTFDLAGHLVAADARTGVVWSLGRPWEDGRVTLTPLVRDGLVRPVGLAVSGDMLIVLDSGDHSVKMYSSQTA